MQTDQKAQQKIARTVYKRNIREHRMTREKLRAYAIEQHREFRKKLDEIVIGQDAAKEAGVKIAYLIDAHMRTGKPLGQHKTNTLFIGPPGSGKTLLSTTIANLVNVPYAGFPLTRVSQSGYVGGNVDDVFEHYVHNALSNLPLDPSKVMDLEDAFESCPGSHCGIIFYDEIDKIICPQTGSGAVDADSFKHKIQYELLDILQGTEIDVPLGHDDGIMVNTTNMTFLCAGAFDGLERVIARRLEVDPEKTLVQDLYRQCTPEDLNEYGMDYQLARRFGKIAFLTELDKSQLLRILTESKVSPLRLEQQKLAAFYGTELVVKKEVHGLIFDLAMRDRKYGASALTSICNDLTEPITSDLTAYESNGKVILDRAIAERHLAARIERKPPVKRQMGFSA